MRKYLIALLVLALVAASCGASDDTSVSERETSSEGDSSATTSGPRSAETGGDESGSEEPVSGEAMSEDGSVAPAEADLTSKTESFEGSASDSESVVDGGPGRPIISPEPTIPPRPGSLTAADVDDNLNIEFFGTYLDRIRSDYGQRLPSFDLSSRIRLEVVGSDGVMAGNARLELTNGDRSAVIHTSSAGVAYIFPSFQGLDPSTPIIVSVQPADGSPVEQFNIAAADSAQGSSQRILLTAAGGSIPPALDVALVLDVTGSMSDELNYLTVEFESIIARLEEDYPNVDMRFALVAYRDIEDAFVTRVFDFTGSIEEFRGNLSDQTADGGGDFPEAMDQALADANELSWRTGNVARVLILNADAPPHDDRFSRTVSEAKALGQKGVRIYPLAASGVDDSAEYIMRAMALSTGGRHLFLTNDSGIGGDHQEPKTECYVVTQLNDLVLRVLAAELAGERVEATANQVLRTVGDYNEGVCL